VPFGPVSHRLANGGAHGAVVVLIAALGIASTTMLAAPQGDDPFVGTWRLSLAKSSLPGPPPLQPYVLTFEPALDGSIVGLVLTVDVNGVQTPVSRLDFRYDGQPYREIDLTSGMPATNSLTFTRLDSRTLDVVHTLNEGRSVFRERRTVSEDGRTMTFVLTASDLQGALSVVQVFDRQ
jgi:hypothetical protein